MTAASLATNCKPVLGYATKGAAILALKASGKSHGEIARMLDMKPRAVASLMCKTLQRKGASTRLLEIETNLFLDLERAAVARGLTAIGLVERLLLTVIVDDLYDAILGD